MPRGRAGADHHEVDLVDPGRLSQLEEPAGYLDDNTRVADLIEVPPRDPLLDGVSGTKNRSEGPEPVDDRQIGCHAYEILLRQVWIYVDFHTTSTSGPSLDNCGSSARSFERWTLSPLFIGRDSLISRLCHQRLFARIAHPLRRTKDRWMDTMESKCKTQLSDQGESKQPQRDSNPCRHLERVVS